MGRKPVKVVAVALANRMTRTVCENGGAKVCHGSGGMSLLRAA
ncbi:hypothetical protein JSE7799_02057 [Jannaschia seosinensis]|uniref:Uncharacterized protein n=1 Tax=Jannaschia seosinensis TaxID=313367 RepID=A0A0M7BBP4_9RHOB|nr:hypothetical protein [Jannaschia seosinensis]CUH39333.1 hypothetical protein JSE7799_02057 [Jannaschia seosinensis]